MMNPEYFRVLFDYTYWARDRVLAAMSGISQDDFARDVGFTYGSVRGILAHCLDAEFAWRCRFEGEARKAPIGQLDVATPDLLRTLWEREEGRMRAYLAGLTEGDLGADLVWRAADSTQRSLPNLWLSLAHVINHSTQHRSEAAEALTMIGRSPGDLDLGQYAGEVGVHLG
jgi:uncharacterized damage-inducible protein DinB